MSSLIGQRLGQYEIIGLLGKGGMATVYRARQLNIKREVAIKVIKPDLAETEMFLKRFEREAETIATLSHPHILKLFDYGHEGELIYLVTELLSGGTISDLIAKGTLSLETTTRIIDQIASALDYAHGLGIIHRDLKPQNVLLDSQGNAFLTDFGIAKLLQPIATLTETGLAIGTPAYMSPEQWQGASLDARTDVYALGIMLFEMLSGEQPFRADTPASIMYLHLQQKPPEITTLRADLPQNVGKVISKALAKKKDSRFASCGELSAALTAAVRGQALPFEPISEAEGPTFVQTGSPDDAYAEAVARQAQQTGARGSAGSKVEHLRARIEAPTLSVEEQKILLFDLKDLLRNPETHAEASTLLRRLYQRDDLYARIADDLREVIEADSATAAHSATRQPSRRGGIPLAALIAAGAVILIAAVFLLMKALGSPATPTSTPALPVATNPASVALAAATTAVPPTSAPTQVSTQLPPTNTPIPSIAPTMTPVPTNTIIPTNTVVPTDTLAPAASPTSAPTTSGSIFPLKEAGTSKIAFVSDRNSKDEIDVVDLNGNNLKMVRGDGVSPFYSPDGKSILYTSQVDGNFEIYVMNANGTDARNLTNNPADDSGAVFSPDGKQIAFVSTRDSHPETGLYVEEIYLMDANGEHQRRMTTLGSRSGSIAWSPDGKRIVFQSGSDATGGLYSLDVGSSVVSRLTFNSLDENPTFSPDGQAIAFDSYRNNNYDVFIMDANGKNEKGVTTNTSSYWNYAPQWSPDGRLLVFGSQRDGLGDIYTINLGSNVVTRVTNTKTPDSLKDSASFSPNGKTILLHARQTAVEIDSMDLTSGATTTLVKKTVLYSAFSFSPDGKQIAFAMQNDGDSNTDIYVAPVNGSAPPRKITSDFYDRDPAFSPDGKQIAYAGYDTKVDKAFNIYMIGVDGGSAHRLTTDDKSNVEPGWSPDGSLIAFTGFRDEVAGEVYVMHADGTHQSRLLHGSDGDTFPRWSGDGQHMLFTSVRSRNQDVYQMNPDGSGLRRLTNDPAYDEMAVYSPSGKYIAFLSHRSGRDAIYLMNPDGSDQRQLTTEIGNDSYPAWVPGQG